MGLLSEGTPLDWPEVKKVADYVREHGIVQLINTFERLQTRTNDVLKWGDEVEYMVVRFDEEHKQAKLVLRGKEFLQKLKETAKHWPETDAGTVAWLPEFGRYMIESTPGGPYQGHLQAFLKVEKNMALRRAQAKAALPSDVHLLSLTVFPRC
ncbi:gamma-glutamylcysteine synthetase heavy subunit [Salpingoeca rosetta]|uniref:Glutamate--cysteine ligase n=1 Tax=Salpingoeca rosetta (strain ATCC 50818 / BSB-021) TaxID=946362 RepID=F2U8Z3_SALR5|nr:gamma-glutamylcysteine synthetase heavy subunit [Salpingoeca rosetta]EGD73196.1 gamma-glutamylcysteine synthetase heavy subunit [Salpingoeca rosetta]|eukprot:XP_004994227.1 gamma-glutamylcysteine synthetase heavy subunit [Salpingoeca rosetta]